MYAPFDPEDPLSQGDIITNVVFGYIPDIARPALIVGEEIVERDLAVPFDQEEELTVLGQAKKSTVAVVSQGCDIDNRAFLSVARVVPLTSVDASFGQMTSPGRIAKTLKEEYQRIGARPAVYYLRESEHFPKSAISFSEIHSIIKTPGNLDYLRGNRILRLTPGAVQDFQFRLSFFFGRFAGTDEYYMLTDEEKELVRRR